LWRRKSLLEGGKKEEGRNSSELTTDDEDDSASSALHTTREMLGLNGATPDSPQDAADAASPLHLNLVALFSEPCNFFPRRPICV
jgi:hypothetical protein